MGLAFLDRPSTGESSLASFVAQVQSAWLAVVFVELVTGYYFLPYGLGWFVGALLLTA